MFEDGSLVYASISGRHSPKCFRKDGIYQVRIDSAVLSLYIVSMGSYFIPVYKKEILGYFDK